MPLLCAPPALLCRSFGGELLLHHCRACGEATPTPTPTPTPSPSPSPSLPKWPHCVPSAVCALALCSLVLARRVCVTSALRIDVGCPIMAGEVPSMP